MQQLLITPFLLAQGAAIKVKYLYILNLLGEEVEGMVYST